MELVKAIIGRDIADLITLGQDIVHRDLKLENILLKKHSHEDDDRFDIKVADFGLSVKTGGVEIGNIMTEACGTLIYMAPEMMSGRGYSQWCDVWSIGVIMFMLLCGEPPFVSQTQRGLLKKIMNKVRFTQPAWASVSDAAKWVLTYLLKVDPAYRMTARQLLETPWIAGDNTVPSGPNNVLEMIDRLLENDKNENRGTEPVKDWSLVSSEDTLEPSLDHNSWSQADLSPEADTPSTPHRMVKESTQQKICTLSTDATGPLPTTAQMVPDFPLEDSLVGVKRPTQLSAKGHRRKSKTDLGTGQKPTSNSSKTEDRPSPTSRGLSSFNQRLVKSPTPNVIKTSEKKTNGAIPRRKT